VARVAVVASVSRQRLLEMVEEATVDCYDDESDEVAGLFAMLDEQLALPFGTQVLGVDVTVNSVELSEDDRIVAVCSRGDTRQVIPVLDLPLPSPPPGGAEWIDAYRFWLIGAAR
jgi:hypothetical protein